MGRPAKKPSAAEQIRVRRLAAAGWSRDRIARDLGVSRGTLEKHFAQELEHGADIKTDQLLQYAWRSAAKGRASAIRWIAARMNRPEEPEHQPTTPAL